MSSIPEDNQPIPLQERWAQDTMEGTKVYGSVEEYLAAKKKRKKRVVKLSNRQKDNE